MENRQYSQAPVRTGSVQGLDKIMETLQMLYTFIYYYGVGPPFALCTAAILGMDSYKF
jgi:hypothetical protein